MRKLYLHYGDFVPANFNMADKTSGELESMLHVNKASAKVFVPRTSWNSYILIYILLFQELIYGKLCIELL